MIIGEQPAEQERRIMSAARTGELVDLSVGDAYHDDPAHGATWDGSRTVRAALLIELLAGERTPARPQAIKIQGARITGPLDLEALELACPLLLRRCRIDEPINLNEAAAPAIRLPGCHVPGLSANQIRLVGNLELNHGFTATGEVRLLGAHIGGQLNLSSAHLTNPGGYALVAGGLTVDQEMYCMEELTVAGELHLIGAHIGALMLRGARLANPGGYALYADGLTVDQSMHCIEGFTAEGEVSLIGAHIGGMCALRGARLTNPGGQALYADQITVSRNLFCDEGFIAEGVVRLRGAHIGGQLLLNGARLTSPGGYALVASGITVDQDMHCTEGFAAEGEVRLRGAHIAGQLALVGASLNNPGGTALNLEAARVAELRLRPTVGPEGIVDFTNARVGTFDDDQATWPRVLWLRGFTYETLKNDQVGVRDRLRWLTRHPVGYTPQIYDQLADTYRRAGHPEAARKVGVAKQRRRRSVLNPFSWLLYVTVGYGYRTWLAGIWLAGLAVVGSYVFTRAYPEYMVKGSPMRPLSTRSPTPWMCYSPSGTSARRKPGYLKAGHGTGHGF